MDSEGEINPFLSEDEQADLLGGTDSEPDQEPDEEDVEPLPAKRARLTSSAKTLDLLRNATAKPLKNDKRRTITAKYPLPACDQAHTPRLDDEIACIVPKGAETHDRYLSKLQQFALDALGAICWLYEGLSSEEGISSTKAKEVLETSIALLGNASAHFSTESRKSVMKHLNKDLRPLCEGKFPDRGPYIFG